MGAILRAAANNMADTSYLSYIYKKIQDDIKNVSDMADNPLNSPEIKNGLANVKNKFLSLGQSIISKTGDFGKSLGESPKAVAKAMAEIGTEQIKGLIKEGILGYIPQIREALGIKPEELKVPRVIAATEKARQGDTEALGKEMAETAINIGFAGVKAVGGAGEVKTPFSQKIIKTGEQKPTIKLKRDVTVTTLQGEKVTIPEDEVLKAYEQGGKALLKDGREYIVSKSQYENIKNNSLKSEAKEFAPELKGTEESVRGGKPNWEGNELIINGERQANVGHSKGEGWFFESDMSEGTEIFKTKAEAMKAAEEDILGTYGKAETKFSSSQLPEGKNYKEILIKAKPETFDRVKMEDLTDAQLAKINEEPFKSSHWDEPNVISHLRLNERTYKGKKVTFMEEMQSDWAREARKADKGKPQEFSDWQGDQIENTLPAGRSNYEEYLKQFNNFPTHPLLKNWQELSVKRALKEAVDNNSEYLAWISGEQTSARYNLATHLKSADWETTGQGRKWINLNPQEGSMRRFVINKEGVVSSAGGGIPEGWIGKKLDEVLGKGLADKIMEKETGQLSGEGLSFGGEWTKNLYDKQVKNIVEDITGHKVEVIDMGLPIDAKSETFKIVTDRGASGRTLIASDLEVGKSISKNSNFYTITKVIGDGKIEVIPKQLLHEKGYYDTRTGWKSLPNGQEYQIHSVETFDISTKKSTGQQAIKITPEIRAMVKGESPKFK